MLRERKASITLGIIMTAFTVCWLPFFILALLGPLMGYLDEIPRGVQSFTLWLGYTNSMLNPIIYVTFHQDFRRAFKELLRCHCSTLNSRLRDDYYLRTYTLEVPNPTHNNVNHDTSILRPSSLTPAPQNTITIPGSGQTPVNGTAEGGGEHRSRMFFNPIKEFV
jgi:hypothetical protein